MAILTRRLFRTPSTVLACDALGKGCAEDGEAVPSELGAAPKRQTSL